MSHEKTQPFVPIGALNDLGLEGFPELVDRFQHLIRFREFFGTSITF